jgi:hypothetical protein
VVAIGDRELLAALREATDNHVLVQSAGGAAYTFRHALLREAIYTDTRRWCRRHDRLLSHGSSCMRTRTWRKRGSVDGPTFRGDLDSG